MQSIDTPERDPAAPARSRGTPPWWLIWLIFRDVLPPSFPIARFSQHPLV